MRMASSPPPERSTLDLEHDPRPSRDILNPIPTGKTSSYSPVQKQQRYCSSPGAKTRKPRVSLKLLSLCLRETRTRCTRRKKLSCQQVL